MITLVDDTNFATAYSILTERMKDSAVVVPQARWQGVDVSKNPAATCYELERVVIERDLQGDESLDRWRDEISPNLPWADDHFLERVGGEPLNPGVEWANWPWGKSAARFRDKGEVFNHTYQERLWPKYARMTDGGKLPLTNILVPHRGIAWEYGDLMDIVRLLIRDPYTRQAYIPLFFPEDTGWSDGGRKPCTLGYQFTVRDSRLNIWYPLRSCDLIRHYRDDVYLAVRLLLWVLDQCRALSIEDSDEEFWRGVTPGVYSMHMTSLHVFENDMRAIRNSQ